MASDMAKLYDIQQLDTQIHQLERERDALDAGAELKAQVTAQHAQAQAARDQLHAMETELRDTELQIKTHDAKKRDFEEKMYSGRVRNPKELEDMQREVQLLGSSVDKLEDRGLDLMEQVEKSRRDLAVIEADVKAQDAQLADVEARYAAESARVGGQIEALQAQRAGLVPAVATDLMRRYDDLRAKRANLAVVKATGDTCPGCRISLSVDTLRQLKRGERVVLCESCGRMLYQEGPPPATEAVPGATP